MGTTKHAAATLDDFLTVQQASALLGVSDSRVKQWLDEGRLPGRKVGRQWLIPRGTCRRPAAKPGGRKPADAA